MATVILSSLVNITKITIPEQNQFIVLLMLSLFYLFIFYIIKKVKKWSTKLWGIKHSLVFVIFLVFVMLVWKWEFLESWSRTISNDISIWTSGEVFYKSFWWIKASVWIFNEYGGSDYDTIKYDLNLDGFVDIKTIDIDENSQIDDIVVYTYNTQKVIFFILLFIFIIVTYFFSDWWKIKIKKDGWDNKKKINLNWLKIFWKNNKNIEIKNNFQKWLALILLLLIILQFWYVSAYKESDLIWTPDYIKWDKICNYVISLNWCKNCNKEYVPMWKEDFYLLKTSNFIAISEGCNDNTPALTRSQFGRFIDGDIDEYIKYMNRELYKSNDEINEFGTIDDEDISDVNTIIITEEDNGLDVSDDSWKPWKIDLDEIINNADPEWLWLNIKDIVWWEELDYLDDYKFDKNNEDKGIINEIEIIKWLDVIWDDKKNNDIKKKVDDALKAIKFINDWSSVALDWINIMKDKIKKIWNWWIIDQKAIDHIRDWLKTLVWTDGLKWINNLIDRDKGAGKYIKNIWWKVWTVFKWLGFIWDVIWWYENYIKSSKKHKWDDSKIYAETIIKTGWKTLIWANPIDFGMWLLSWWASMIWFNWVAKIIDENTIWNRYEQVVDIANNDEWSSINQTIDSSAADFLKVYNNSNSWTLDKVIKFGEFVSVMTVWMLWFATQAWMGAVEWSFDAFDWGMSEIINYFK